MQVSVHLSVTVLIPWNNNCMKAGFEVCLGFAVFPVL